MACPLCDCDRARPSWLGSTYYLSREFAYVECLRCKSLYCNPMPDAQTLAEMYGPAYESSFASEPVLEENKDHSQVTGWLEKTPPGTFIDYGCGSGGLLREAARLGWEVVGVEFEEEVARSVEARTGVRVYSRIDSLNGTRADALHLGDVIEHLTELNRQMPEILQLVKPGGLIIAQGPLEANTNLFTTMLKLGRLLRRKPSTESAPYHVLLATAKGQREFFRRFGLEEVVFTVREVAWPATDRLARSDIGNPRSVALFVIRRLSQAASALRPNDWGNRYFYAGRVR